MLHFWLYISRARIPPRSADDALIYLQARNRNAAHEISGYLHRESGVYVQYVEGPANAVERLRRLIRGDRRHSDLRVLAEGHTLSRRFSGWDMAFTNEETSSFRAYQALFGGETDIASAPARDVLAFMDHMALSGRARSVRELA